MSNLSKSLSVSLAGFILLAGFSAFTQDKTKKVPNKLRSATITAILTNAEYSKDFVVVPSEELAKSEYAGILKFYTENALKSLNMTPRAEGKLKVTIDLQVTQMKRKQVIYSMVATEGGKEKWRVSSNCTAALKLETDSLLPGLVACALSHVGQTKTSPLMNLGKYPQYLTAVYGEK